MKLDAASFLLQWAAGGLLFGWVTTRRREVSLGYGWTFRIVFGLMAIAATFLFSRDDLTAARTALVSSIATTSATAFALTISVVRRQAGATDDETPLTPNASRVAAMVGRGESGSETLNRAARNSPPRSTCSPLPVAVTIGLFPAAQFAGGPYTRRRHLRRRAVSIRFTDTMLLGHWYLVQPGLRDPLFHGDGRDRPALPRDPHRLRHRPRCPRRPVLIAWASLNHQNGGSTTAQRFRR